MLLLPLISKIIEKIVTTRQMDFCQTTKYYITINLDSELITRLISIDLQKAFDTINHEILLKKLEAIGFSDKCIRWFRSYLCERIFFIEIERINSLKGIVRKGIVRCASRFYFRTIEAPCFCQRHALGCKMKSIFICR